MLLIFPRISAVKKILDWLNPKKNLREGAVQKCLYGRKIWVWYICPLTFAHWSFPHWQLPTDHFPTGTFAHWLFAHWYVCPLVHLPIDYFPTDCFPTGTFAHHLFAHWLICPLIISPLVFLPTAYLPTNLFENKIFIFENFAGVFVQLYDIKIIWLNFIFLLKYKIFTMKYGVFCMKLRY